eukprot:365595-Chlamydomonas_euryale.AAC.11
MTSRLSTQVLLKKAHRKGSQASYASGDSVAAIATAATSATAAAGAAASPIHAADSAGVLNSRVPRLLSLPRSAHVLYQRRTARRSRCLAAAGRCAAAGAARCVAAAEACVVWGMVWGKAFCKVWSTWKVGASAFRCRFERRVGPRVASIRGRICTSHTVHTVHTIARILKHDIWKP